MNPIEALIESIPPREGALVNVIIDTPRGSGSKLKLDPKHGCFRLSHILPVGHVFPFDFGSIPGTLADDGDALDALGLGEGALARMVRTAYHLLGLRTFLTTGEKESRAWTFRAGAKAPECAGVIHSDLQRGFIRAEVVGYNPLIARGSMAACRDHGEVRLEGKEYVVQDGDVLNIRFNV